MKKAWELSGRRAKGIVHCKGETNIGLAVRKYDIDCNHYSKDLITTAGGYFLWWCTVHHQPLAWCTIAKLEIKLNGIKDIIKD